MSETFGAKIVAYAVAQIGQQEIPNTNNAGFLDKKFEAAMREVGWSPGQAWCALFSERCWVTAYQGQNNQLSIIDKMFSASAVTTFRNFDAHAKALLSVNRQPYFAVSREPVPGAVVIWRHGVGGWQGHAGIVESADGGWMRTIEGNTNDRGGREGYIVARKNRPIDFSPKEGRLNLLGFILPWEPAP